MINEFDPSASQATLSDRALVDLLERRSRVLGPSYKLFYDQPIHFVRGEGVRLFDHQGRAYLDVYNNVPAVGHCHPKVVEAIAQQSATLNTHTRYLSEIIINYAEKLVATFPAALSKVMFTCTGSEANDLAFRVAHEYTGNEGLIVTRNGYHGITAAVAEASPSLGSGVPLGKHVRTVPAPDAFRIGEAGVAEQFERSVREAVNDLQRHGMRPAALIFDTIFSSDGVLSEPPGFIQGAVRAVRDAGGLFIADEVQPGFGRTGETMWGFQRHSVEPDIVTIGKPMGNGMPIAGMLASPELLAGFALKARYFNTFGGNPVSCAAALATLEVIQEESLQENARVVGAYLRQGLSELAQEYEQIGDVRGAGLFIGVDIVRDHRDLSPNPDFALALVNRLRELYVLISASGPDGHALKIRPPLVFSKTDADEFLDKMRRAIIDVRDARCCA
ncbi:MAG: aspartate aminotransferase family protein [Pseudomonadota bacterium]